MSSTLLRLRRTVSLSSAILSRHTTVSASTTAVIHRYPTPFTAIVPSRYFRSSSVSLMSSVRRSFNNNNLDDEIGPDDILFEGCDYNHWLITMDFPKDPAPTRDEMIETYLQTCAKVVGSYEEAKKKMYACSTTTYQGFQCLVSEEESEKFKGLPGVVFVLPDSYIDPVNKEYGGDKYDNGIITPRPPPMQYGRQGGRYGDRNRDFNRNPRQMPNEQGTRGHDNQGLRYGDNRNLGPQQNPSVPHQQGNRGYDNQGSRYEDNRNFSQQYNPQVPYQQRSQAYPNQGPTSGMNRNIGQEQYPPVQPSFGPTVGGERRDLPANAAPQARDSFPIPINSTQEPNQHSSSAYGNQGPAYGVTTNFRQEQYPPVQPNNAAGGERRGPLPMNTSPRGRDVMPPYQDSNYNQNQQGYHNPQGERVPPQHRGYTGDNRNYAPPQGDVTQGQGAEGNYKQMGGGDAHRSGGSYGQTQGSSNNTHGEEGNYGQFGQTRGYQGRY